MHIGIDATRMSVLYYKGAGSLVASIERIDRAHVHVVLAVLWRKCERDACIERCGALLFRSTLLE